jgi:hypothetical protein
MPLCLTRDADWRPLQLIMKRLPPEHFAFLKALLS